MSVTSQDQAALNRAIYKALAKEQEKARLVPPEQVVEFTALMLVGPKAEKISCTDFEVFERAVKHFHSQYPLVPIVLTSHTYIKVVL